MIAMALRDNAGRELIDCREAARRYGCTMRYIRALVTRGTLSAEIAGGTYLLDAAQVEGLKKRVAKGKGRNRPRADKFKPG
jgi:excisionase family DNA binding protein